jgi:hypothetical protein
MAHTGFTTKNVHHEVVSQGETCLAKCYFHESDGRRVSEEDDDAVILHKRMKSLGVLGPLIKLERIVVLSGLQKGGSVLLLLRIEIVGWISEDDICEKNRTVRNKGTEDRGAKRNYEPAER